MKLSDLTPRQQQLLDYLRSEVAAGKSFPTPDDLAKQFNKHRSTMVDHLWRLEAKGEVIGERIEVHGEHKRYYWQNGRPTVRWSLPDMAAPRRERPREVVQPAYQDRVGERYGHLTIIAYAGTERRADGSCRGATWRCRCDCGALRTIRGRDLAHAKSCGCQRREAVKEQPNG